MATQRYALAAALASLAMVSNAVAASGPAASATVSPTSGYPGAKLVATYTFAAKSSCSAFHGRVSWSFGSTAEWATGPAPSQAGSNCTSSTPSTAPPPGAAPGAYAVCGTDGSVNPTPACATYTIKPAPPPPGGTPPPGPNPTPAAAPSPSASPLSSPSPPAPGAVAETPSPSPPAGSAPPISGGGGSTNDVRAAASHGGIPGWPWIAVLLLVFPLAGAWRYRSWLVGVFENVEVLGTTGADIENELLHHQASPPAGPEAPPADADARPGEDGLHGDAD